MVPFLIWIDHKNLAYLRSAKRLNSRQACRSLFLSCFNYTLSYRPGSRNTKPDTLSRLHSPATSSGEPETIIPATCIVGAASWDIEAVVKEAQKTQPDPGTGPPNRLFVPEAIRSQVLQWGHSSKLTCHPGASRTILFLHQHFWWPSMVKDTREFMAACSVCARGWILSLDCLLQMVTQLYSLLLIVFLNQFITFHYPSYPQPLKQ